MESVFSPLGKIIQQAFKYGDCVYLCQYLCYTKLKIYYTAMKWNIHWGTSSPLILRILTMLSKDELRVLLAVTQPWLEFLQHSCWLMPSEQISPWEQGSQGLPNPSPSHTCLRHCIYCFWLVVLPNSLSDLMANHWLEFETVLLVLE